MRVENLALAAEVDTLKKKLGTAEAERADAMKSAGQVQSRLESEKALLERELSVMRNMCERIMQPTPQAWPAWSPLPSTHPSLLPQRQLAPAP